MKYIKHFLTLPAGSSDTLKRSAVSRPPTLFVSGGLASRVTPVETRLTHDTGHFLLG
jgi:hypothetical protein